jgi:hypothetical protein
LSSSIIYPGIRDGGRWRDAFDGVYVHR